MVLLARLRPFLRPLLIVPATVRVRVERTYTQQKVQATHMARIIKVTSGADSVNIRVPDGADTVLRDVLENAADQLGVDLDNVSVLGSGGAVVDQNGQPEQDQYFLVPRAGTKG